MCVLHLLHLFYINCPHYHPTFKHCTNTSIRLQIKKFRNVNFSHHPMLLLPVPNILPNTLFTNIRTLYSARNQFQYTHKTTDKLIVSCISVFRIEPRLQYFVFMFISIIIMIINHSYSLLIAKEKSWKTTEMYPLMKLRRLGFAYTCALSYSVAGIMACSTAATARNVVNICSPDLFRNTLFKQSWKQRIPQDLPQYFELNHIRPRITLFLHTHFLTTCTLLHDPKREDVS